MIYDKQAEVLMKMDGLTLYEDVKECWYGYSSTKVECKGPLFLLEFPDRSHCFLVCEKHKRIYTDRRMEAYKEYT